MPPLCSIRFVVPLFLACLLPVSLCAEFTENFDRFRVDRSLYKESVDWKKFNSGDQAQPAGNSAMLRREGEKRYLSLLAHGHKTANARIYQNIHLPVSETSNHRFAIDIRPVSPETEASTCNGAVLTLAGTKGGEFDPEGRFQMGIVKEQEELVFSFIAGKGFAGRIHSRPGEVQVQPHQWYRFEAELQPSSGRVEVVVYALDGNEKTRVWSASNEGLPPWHPEVISQINLMVTRPGTLEEKTHSADFANLAITP